MKILKIILIVLGLIIAMPLVIALFVKKDYAVEREIIISKPKQEVFDYVMRNKSQMPRTSLRYAIEKMREEMRKKAMA